VVVVVLVVTAVVVVMVVAVLVVVVILRVVIDAGAGELAVVHGLPACGRSIEAVYSGHLVDDGSQSSCPVSLVKLDWESVNHCDLSTLAADVDCIIATGLIVILTCVVLVLLFTSLNGK